MRALGRTAAAGRGERTRHDRDLFDRVAGSYARKDLLPASRRARQLRLEQTVRAVRLPPRPEIVEIGCGAGFAAEYLAGRFGRYLGIDHSAALVDAARARHGAPHVRFVAADAMDVEVDRPADLVLMIGVLHHLEDPGAVLARARAWLRPGGFVAVNEPHPGNPLVSLLRRARKRLDGAYSDEQCEIGGRALRGLFDHAGLVDVALAPQGVLSTPFAEVILRPAALARAASVVACAADRALESIAGPLLRPLSWNLVATGRRPGNDTARTRRPAPA